MGGWYATERSFLCAEKWKVSLIALITESFYINSYILDILPPTSLCCSDKDDFHPGSSPWTRDHIKYVRVFSLLFEYDPVL